MALVACMMVKRHSYSDRIIHPVHLDGDCTASCGSGWLKIWGTKMWHDKKCRGWKCETGQCGRPLQGWQWDKLLWKAKETF